MGNYTAKQTLNKDLQTTLRQNFLRELYACKSSSQVIQFYYSKHFADQYDMFYDGMENVSSLESFINAINVENLPFITFIYYNLYSTLQRLQHDDEKFMKQLEFVIGLIQQLHNIGQTSALVMATIDMANENHSKMSTNHL